MTDGPLNALAPTIIKMVCQPAIENPKLASSAIEVLERVVAGAIDFLVKPGCDDVVLDSFFESVKDRLAELRKAELEHANQGGTA
jgi:hypothetical protein